VYINNGFEEEYEIPVDYMYLNKSNNIIDHKSLWKKESFRKLGIDIGGKTEKQLASEYGLLRCYDCGKIMYRLECKI